MKMNELQHILNWMQSEFPHLERSFHDGKNEQGKQICNPTYGFGSYLQSYASKEGKNIFQIGIAQTKSGISIYLLGIRGKMDLPAVCQNIGKAKVTGYCISFRKMEDIDQSILHLAINEALNITNL